MARTPELSVFGLGKICDGQPSTKSWPSGMAKAEEKQFLREVSTLPFYRRVTFISRLTDIYLVIHDKTPSAEIIYFRINFTKSYWIFYLCQKTH